jgi:hypothetical protein
MTPAHGSGEPGPCAAVPPNPVFAPPVGVAHPGGIDQVDDFEAAGAVDDDLRVDGVVGEP